jgi:hypothetical protein
MPLDRAPDGALTRLMPMRLFRVRPKWQVIPWTVLHCRESGSWTRTSRMSGWWVTERWKMTVLALPLM